MNQPIHHDQLTGVPNQLSLVTHLPERLAQAARTGRSLALVFLDLDRFRQINDSRGRATGDQLLRAVARRLRTWTRPEDLVARTGDDEFAVVLCDLQSEEQIRPAIERLLQSLRDPFIIDGQPLVTSASAGASLSPRDGATACQLLQHAGAALARAKALGRNRWQIYGPAMSRQLGEQVQIESHLRQAIRDRALEVHYQPIVAIPSQRVVALESVLRWRDPGREAVLPEGFISVAEETGLIVPIGDFVLGRVLEDIARWRAERREPVPVALNVSAVQLRRSNFPERLLAAARHAGVTPKMLQVELTESAAFDSPAEGEGEWIEDPVMRLQELGVHIALDDFGTRYSCLSYLKRWRVDSLKIDRAFVSNLTTDAGDLAIVAALCELGRRLKIPVVAEGVESREQLQTLRELGCPLAQGYLFSKPVPAADCGSYLDRAPLGGTLRLEPPRRRLARVSLETCAAPRASGGG